MATSLRIAHPPASRRKRPAPPKLALVATARDRYGKDIKLQDDVQSATECLARILAGADPQTVAAALAVIAGHVESATGLVPRVDLSGYIGWTLEVHMTERAPCARWGKHVALAFAGPRQNPALIEREHRDRVRDMCKEYGLPSPWTGKARGRKRGA